MTRQPVFRRAPFANVRQQNVDTPTGGLIGSGGSPPGGERAGWSQAKPNRISAIHKGARLRAASSFPTRTALKPGSARGVWLIWCMPWTWPETPGLSPPNSAGKTSSASMLP